MIFKKILPITFYVLLIISVVVFYFFDKDWGNFFIFKLIILLVLLFYVVFAQRIKEESSGFGGLQLVIMIVSILTTITLFYRTIDVYFHWPYNNQALTLLFGLSSFNGLLVIIDLIINFRRKNKIAGYQYFLILFPCILYFNSIHNSVNQSELSPKLMLADDLHMLDAHYALKGNDSIIYSLSLYSCIDSTLLFKVQKERNKIVELITDIRNEIIAKTGGIKLHDGKMYYPGFDQTRRVQRVLIGKDENGRAYNLQNRLNAYVALLKRDGYKAPELALDGYEHPLFKRDPENKNKDFAEVHFVNANLIESLIILSNFQRELLILESRFLSEQMHKCMSY